MDSIPVLTGLLNMQTKTKSEYEKVGDDSNNRYNTTAKILPRYNKKRTKKFQGVQKKVCHFNMINIAVVIVCFRLIKLLLS